VAATSSVARRSRRLIDLSCTVARAQVPRPPGSFEKSVVCASVRECPPTECCRLIDALQEREHAFPEQCRSLFVVVEEAVVSEQVPIARIQE